MRAYYGSRISDNMTRTPEGFLVCHNVPIARTGKYDYLAQEVGMDGTDVVAVYRDETQVFDARAIASFEGKAFCDEHPSESVIPGNWSMYAKGKVSNVRRGKESESDMLVADIIVRDPTVIREIEGGKREVSAGYECEYEMRDGKVYQINIRGNHVALVPEGRAGKRARIKDESTLAKRLRTLRHLQNAANILEED